jgi:hypothetical protein
MEPDPEVQDQHLCSVENVSGATGSRNSHSQRSSQQNSHSDSEEEFITP